MKIDSNTHSPGKNGRLARYVCASNGRALGLLISTMQSLLFLLLLVPGDWEQTLQRHAGYGQALADAQDSRNILANRTEATRALVASSDRQRFKARLADAPDAAPPGQTRPLSGPDGHSPHAAPDLAHLAPSTSSAYRARAPPVLII